VVSGTPGRVFGTACFSLLVIPSHTWYDIWMNFIHSQYANCVNSYIWCTSCCRLLMTDGLVACSNWPYTQYISDHVQVLQTVVRFIHIQCCYVIGWGVSGGERVRGFIHASSNITSPYFELFLFIS
jgi:hypothetical protein